MFGGLLPSSGYDGYLKKPDCLVLFAFLCINLNENIVVMVRKTVYLCNLILGLYVKNGVDIVDGHLQVPQVLLHSGTTQQTCTSIQHLITDSPVVLLVHQLQQLHCTNTSRIKGPRL